MASRKKTKRAARNAGSMPPALARSYERYLKIALALPDTVASPRPGSAWERGRSVFETPSVRAFGKFLSRWRTEAEGALATALRQAGVGYEINAGDGAFYGPKIDFVVLDALKRPWQLATVQLDFGALPERFDLSYVRPDGSIARPVMIHRAILGTIERFMGILIEHCAGAFPLWLAPVQVRVLTLTERTQAYGASVCARLRATGVRAELDDRNEKLGYKVREAQLAKIPYMLVVGDKEAEADTVAPRSRNGGSSAPIALDAFLAQIHAERLPSSSTLPASSIEEPTCQS